MNDTPRRHQPGIEWGTVLLGGAVLRAYRDRANGTISYLKPPANYALAAHALAATFREDSASDARQVTA
jgi:hypothetical protein